MEQNWGVESLDSGARFLACMHEQKKGQALLISKQCSRKEPILVPTPLAKPHTHPYKPPVTTIPIPALLPASHTHAVTCLISDESSPKRANSKVFLSRLANRNKGGENTNGLTGSTGLEAPS